MGSLGQVLPENKGEHPGADETFGNDRGPGQMQPAGGGEGVPEKRGGGLPLGVEGASKADVALREVELKGR